jgi:hypothetical protein
VRDESRAATLRLEFVGFKTRAEHETAKHNVGHPSCDERPFTRDSAVFHSARRNENPASQAAASGRRSVSGTPRTGTTHDSIHSITGRSGARRSLQPVAPGAQSGPDQNLLEMRAEQIAGAVSTGRPEEMERLVKDHFDEGMQKIPIAIFMSIEAQAPYRISAVFPVGLIKKVSPSRCHTLRRESAATLRSCASSMRT